MQITKCFLSDSDIATAIAAADYYTTTATATTAAATTTTNYVLFNRPIFAKVRLGIQKFPQ